MELEPNVSLDVLMDELNRLLDEKIQDQVIRQCFKGYGKVHPRKVWICSKRITESVCRVIFVPFTKAKTVVGMHCMFCTRGMPQRANAPLFI